MKKQTYLFNGIVTALSPLATCSKALKDTATKNSPSLPIPTIRAADGERMYMPGQGIRSKLRGALTHIAGENVLLHDGKRFSVQDAQYLRVGGVKQGGAEANISPVLIADMLSKNPLISLFGAATPWVTGKAMVGHAVDTRLIERNVYEPLLNDGVRADPFRRDPVLIHYLADSKSAMEEMYNAAQRVKAYSACKKAISEMEKKIKATNNIDDKTKLRAELARLKENAKELQVVSTQMPLDGYKAIPPGAKLDHKMRLLSVSQIELGAFLSSLDRFAKQPLLGAHIAHGCGEIEAEWEVVKAGEGVIGKVRIIPFEGIEIIGSDELELARGVFQAALDNGEFEFGLDLSILKVDGEVNDEK